MTDTAATPATAPMPPAYDAAAVERRIYQTWWDAGYFAPRINPDRPPFCVVMPPPNVTGELHLGHALTASLQDALARWRRMCGDPTLWLPGKDHAGIATQWVVERALAEEGANRHQLGREKFEARVWEWVARYGSAIDEQHRRLGASCDWSRLRFTLDPGPVRAVRTTFVNLYRKGLIYRHERIINWCPRCATALSDLEVDYAEQDGKLYHIRYPMADGSGGYVTVATTRPESMLGDTGVAVHPDDDRYRGQIGAAVILPIANRPIPIVADAAIEMDFGTGALKVTPGHDVVDFEIGERHNLPIINIIGFDGNMTAAAGPRYAGMERFAARNAIAAELESLGVLEQVEDYHHSVGHCQRCSEVVEPLISLQWFLNVGRHTQPDSIAGRAYAAVVNGDIAIVPPRFARVYLNWLENIRDWCVSRQLWWGHRIPVWYCADCGGQSAHIDDPHACPHCASPNIAQENDVLDTWFSSGLWPHSTLGWPDTDDPDLRYFYPNSILETGYDILFFWVARMIMLGIENTGQVPFRAVYLHGMVLDAHGQKMSKTRGNTLDPLDLLEQYGTDALRFALTTGTAPGNNLRLSDDKLESARNFANKIWNAARFVIAALDAANLPPHALAHWRALPAPRRRADRWIIGRLDAVTAAVNHSLAAFELGDAQQKLYDFIWNDFCDWYIEMAKVRLRNAAAPAALAADDADAADTAAAAIAGDAVDSPNAAAVDDDAAATLLTLAHTLERSLRLLHPFMPFVTEEIRQNLVARLPAPSDADATADADAAGAGAPVAPVAPSIMVDDYPRAEIPRAAPDADAELEVVMQTIRAVRNMRAQLRIPAGQKLAAAIETNGMAAVVNDAREVICALARIEPLHILDEGNTAATGSATAVSGNTADGTGAATGSATAVNADPADGTGATTGSATAVNADPADGTGATTGSATGVSLVVNPLVVRLPLDGVNLAGELERLTRELADTERHQTRVRTLLDNPNFVAKARPEVVENERQRLQTLTEQRARLNDIITQLRP